MATTSSTDQGVTLVTGASGSVGQHVVRGLIEAGRPVRSAMRGGRAQQPGRTDETVAFDFADPATFPAALDGVDRVFLMRPPAISDVKQYLRPFIRAAADREVRQVVFLSLMGVNRVMPHWQVERDLEAAAVPHTFVRPSFFTQNLSMAYRDDIRLHDRIRLPAGSGRTSFIDTRDVAAVIVLALRDPESHAGKSYTITGPRAWPYSAVAEMLGLELGRPVRYDRVGFLRYRKDLLEQGLPVAYARVQLLINAVARIGLAARTTETFVQLTGRRPITLGESIHYLREAWRRDT